MLGWVALAVLGSAVGCAALYDLRVRRRGASLRRPGELLNESLHSRVDIDALPYEPARHAGQRDWATYRRRDRRRPDGGRDAS
jgi:hypothetical protein